MARQIRLRQDTRGILRPLLESKGTNRMLVGRTSWALAYTAPSSQPRESKPAPADDKAEKPYVFTLESDENLAEDRLFQNLLKNEHVQKYVTINDDGTYSFDSSVRIGLIEHEIGFANADKLALARDFIQGQGVAAYGLDNLNSRKQTDQDLALFKQLTGYNLFINAYGSQTVVDDFGNPPRAQDAGKVKDALGFIDDVGSARTYGYGGFEGELTIDNVTAVLKMRNLELPPLGGSTDVDLVDQLLEILRAQAEQRKELQNTENSGETGSVLPSA